MRIALIYDSSLPAHNEDGGATHPDGGQTFINYPVPMVFGWDVASHRVFQDEKAAAKSGMADTLPALLKALR